MKRRISLIIFAMIALCLAMGSIAGPILAAESRGMGAGALPVELQSITVKDVFIPSPGKAVGVIQTVIGHVVVFREDVKEAYYGAPGDRLFERDGIHTLKASRCRFKLDGEDVVTIAEDTRIGIRSFTEDRARGVKNSVFSMTKGKAMFYALKLLRHREAGMTVDMPTAVVGVRGTKFGTEINTAQEITSVHFFEGRGDVVSKIDGAGKPVRAGQSVDITPRGLGGVLPTPPAVGQKFRTDTDVPAPVSKIKSLQTAAAPSSGQTSADKKEEKKDEKEQPPSGSDAESGTPPTTDTAGGGMGTGTPPVTDTSTISQIQTTSGVTTVTDPVTDPGPNATNVSGSHTGYVSGMLTNSTGSSLEEVFVSTTRQNSDSNGWLRGSKDTSTDYLRFYGGGGGPLSDPSLKWAAFDSGAKKSGDLNLAINHTELGTQPGTNFEWGYWTEPTAFTVGSSNYLVDNRGYYLFGPNATNAQVAAFTGTATYSGKAYGTYWKSTGGQDMTGTFSCDVNFAATTNQISNFDLSVSSGAYRAEIQNALGTYGTDGCFQVTGGTWVLQNAASSVTPDQQMAYGSFYSKADYIGGAWGMYHTASNTGAAGIFEGAPKPTEWKGEFTAAPRKNLNSTEIWVSKPATAPQPQDFSVAGSEAKDSTNSNWTKITADKWTDTSTPIMTEVNASGVVSRTITRTEIGHNEYMAWGYWTQPVAILATDSYTFGDKGYYVYGQVTSPMPTTGSGTYSGNAYGTLVKTGTTDAAVDLTGTFNMGVNFVSGEISNYNLSAKDSSNVERVNIKQSGTAASFSGASYLISSPLTVKIDGSTTGTSGAVRGTFYGTDASRTGGSWVVNNASTSAGGIFVGAKQ